MKHAAYYSRFGLLLVALSFAATPGQAASITNGDFGTGDFTGWSLDTDGAPGGANDFTVTGAPGNHAGRVEADFWSTPGDTFSTPLNDVFFANTLFQELDTSLAAGALLQLSFNWDFGGQDGDVTVGEIFSVGLNDGTGAIFGPDGLLGHLIDPTTSYASGSFSAFLDTATFANTSNWFLDVQLAVGVDASGFSNGLGSYIELGNVALSEVPAAAPAPASAALLLLGLPLMLRIRRQRRL